jgi:hypothetical protein
MILGSKLRDARDIGATLPHSPPHACPRDGKGWDRDVRGANECNRLLSTVVAIVLLDSCVRLR